MNYLHCSLQKLASDPDEMCHAPWLVNIGLFVYGWFCFIAFGWVFVGLCREFEAVGPKIIVAMLFSGFMALFGLFFIVAEIGEMYLKTFIIPRAKR